MHKNDSDSIKGWQVALVLVVVIVVIPIMFLAKLACL